jgi:hypothetical protein
MRASGFWQQGSLQPALAAPIALPVSTSRSSVAAVSPPERPASARMLVDFDGKTIWLPKHEADRPAAEFLRKKRELAA